MATVWIRNVPDQVRDTLAEVARSRGQSTQAYLRNLLEQEARRASNTTLLNRVRSVGGGYAAEPGETAREIAGIRNDRDRRDTT